MSVEETAEKAIKDFWSKSDDIFIGFSDSGEFNIYLDSVDDECTKYINNFIHRLVKKTCSNQRKKPNLTNHRIVSE